jgi:hypothetical protein
MGFNERLVEQLKLQIEFLIEEKEQNKIRIKDLESEIGDLKLEKVNLDFDNWVYKKENEKLKTLLNKFLNEEDE